MAVSWLRLLAIACRIHNVRLIEVGLGLGVWIIYVGDRYLDEVAVNPGSKTLRRPSLWTLAVALVAELYLTFEMLDPHVVRVLLPLLFVVALYFLVIHRYADDETLGWPREVAVGILFALGVSLPISALIKIDVRFVLWVFCLASLTTLNCCGIKTWALPLSRNRHWLTRLIGDYWVSACIGLAFTAAVLRTAVGGPFLLAISFSAFCLAALPVIGKYWRSPLRCVAVDLALCSPLLLPSFWK